MRVKAFKLSFFSLSSFPYMWTKKCKVLVSQIHYADCANQSFNQSYIHFNCIQKKTPAAGVNICDASRRRKLQKLFDYTFVTEVSKGNSFFQCVAKCQHLSRKKRNIFPMFALFFKLKKNLFESLFKFNIAISLKDVILCIYHQNKDMLFVGVAKLVLYD